MIEYNAKLNNFFGAVAAPLQTQIRPKIISEKKFSIGISGKFHELDPACPRCNSFRINNNGNDKCKSKVIRELGLVIKRGKFRCKDCGCTWTTQYEEAELFVRWHKGLISTEVFNLCAYGISLDKVSEHILTVFGEKISREWIRQLYIISAKKIEKKKVLSTSGIFHYDEQYLKINGEDGIRIVVLDAVTGKAIFDERAKNRRIETLKDELNMRMLPYKKESFIVDLALGYPEMLKELFPNVKIQWCIFHLNKLIVADFESERKLNKYGKKVLPLLQLHNIYLMLNIFFNHEAELSFIKRQLKKLDKHKEFLKGCRCYEGNSPTISFYEMKLISEFNEFRKSLKKNRRKHKEKYLLRHSKNETVSILEKLEREIGFFHKKARKRIRMIKKNLEKFTLFQENSSVPPTNNRLEQYYSATLQKTAKKKFRSKESLNLKLKIAREKWNKTLTNLNFNFFAFMQLFAKISFLFSPT